MAKNFMDVMSNAGYGTTRADDPSFTPERIEDGLGAGTSSDSSGSDKGPSCKFQDDVNGEQLRGINARQNNDITTLPQKSNRRTQKEQTTNPYTGLQLPDRDLQATF